MEIISNTPKANAVYKVRTMATIYTGGTMKRIPIEFNVLEMPWDKGKSVEQLVKDVERSATIEFSMKKKHLVIEKMS